MIRIRRCHECGAVWHKCVCGIRLKVEEHRLASVRRNRARFLQRAADAAAAEVKAEADARALSKLKTIGDRPTRTLLEAEEKSKALAVLGVKKDEPARFVWDVENQVYDTHEEIAIIFESLAAKTHAIEDTVEYSMMRVKSAIIEDGEQAIPKYVRGKTYVPARIRERMAFLESDEVSWVDKENDDQQGGCADDTGAEG